MNDRVGIGWRPELTCGILTFREQIDVIEIIAEDCFDTKRQKAIKTLSRQIPVSLHGVSCGLASIAPVEQKRLDQIARLVGEVEPESWSEHLAFVRAGGHEIGHLAAPPRDVRTIEGAVANIERAAKTVGTAPMMENIATLVDPPASTLDEGQWISGIVRESKSGLLLDLHNLHANAFNFGFDAHLALRKLPLERISHIHIAGGRLLASRGSEPRRVLDDHLHPVPNSVFDLLREVALLVDHPLTVILERDGRFPEMTTLLDELKLARKAMAEGRGRRVKTETTFPEKAVQSPKSYPSTGSLEALLARLYSDGNEMSRFLRDPISTAQRAGIADADCLAFENIDRVGFELAFESFGRKRGLKSQLRHT